MGRPVVVTEIRPETGEVVIGEADDVFRTTLRADRLNWMSAVSYTHLDVYKRQSQCL